MRNTQESSGSSELHHSNAGEVLVSDAMRTTVSSVIGAFAATSARPCPWNHVRPPPVITATAAPAHGQRSRT